MILQGQGVSGGIAVGQLHFINRSEEKFSPTPIQDVQAELRRFENARVMAAAQLGELAVTTATTLGKENSLLFEIHQMMLEDLDYREAVDRIIKDQKVCAEYAVQQTASDFARMFSEMDDDYMRGRAADVQDVSRRVLEILTGKQPQNITSGQPAILASDDFAPSETAQFDRNKVLALATSGGSANSHTAIFARTMGIPAVIDLQEKLDPKYDGKQIVLDGDTGKVYIEPDEKTLADLLDKQKQQQQLKKQLEQFRGKPSVSKSGRKIQLFANIGTPADLNAVLENDAEGIGLFRSEFLYLETQDYPDEQTQYEAYKTVAEKMNGKTVIIRTLDIGADKQVPYFKLPQEENPALGMRAIRICLTRPEVFTTQLRALYRASAFGKIGIMFPMITSVQEVKRAKKIAADVRRQLQQEGHAFDEKLPLGIMIETPAAAIISDELAKHVDFFSIGTNDLTQYTLAVDRQNQSIAEFCDTHHPAVLRLIHDTAKNAHKNGIWVGICGELGADPSLTKTFLEYGIDELSVSPSAILPLRKQVSETE